MIEAYKKFFRNYTNFSGRSTRSDYWWVVLANFLIGFVIGFVFGFIGGLTGTDVTKLTNIVTTIYELVIIVPAIALVIRRLHDINKSGWYYFMILIPIIGWIIVLVYFCSPSVNENNKYGPIAE